MIRVFNRTHLVLFGLVAILQSPIVCHNLEHAARIAGGELAKENQFPYQVGLNIEIDNGEYIWCGGSLISARWILTAAHCLIDIKTVYAYLGSLQRLKPKELRKLYLKNVYLHAEFDKRTLQHDIALLYLTTAVKYSAGIKPIRLPSISANYDSYVNRKATTSGWGRMDDASNRISNELRFIECYVESNEDCKFVYGSSIKCSNVCMDTTGGKSTCTGDSGGPLAVVDNVTAKNTTAVLIGLTSFGKSSGCTKGYPAVFTRITSYLSWIYEVSGVIYN